MMIIKKKFGVYYYNELIDTIEATSLEEAEKNSTQQNRTSSCAIKI